MINIFKCPSCLHITFLQPYSGLSRLNVSSFHFRRRPMPTPVLSNPPSCYSLSRPRPPRPTIWCLSCDILCSFKRVNHYCSTVHTKSVTCVVGLLSKYGHILPSKHLCSYDKSRYCSDQQEVNTNTAGEEMNKTMARKNEESACTSDSDSEICVVYNYKEERSRGAVEIVLDDDEGEVETLVNSDSRSSGNQVKRHWPNLLKKNQNIKDTSTQPPGTFDRPTASCSSDVNDDIIILESDSSSSSDDSESPEMDTAETPPQQPDFVPNQLGISPAEVEAVRANLEGIRFWEYTNLGSGMVNNLKSPNQLVFSVMSYNVLSQSLLEEHPYLYREHDPRALSWEHRSEILLKEFTLANADILCLQEVQQSHLDTFYNRLNGLGYKGIFKQRTGGKGDGAAIYFKKSMFSLKEHSSVEYYQPGVSVLNRDNVGLIAKLAVNGQARKHVVVATTHLLFNPRRHDVKLAQTQLLLAEVERFAYSGEHPREKCPTYCPSIITGDLNLEPYTGVYQLLTSGMLRYEGLSTSRLSLEQSSRVLEEHLIPRDLEVTDTCQHYSILSLRPTVVSFEEQRKAIKLYHSDDSKYRSYKDYVREMRRRGHVNSFTPQPHTSRKPRTVSPSSLPPEGFGTGQLSHHLNLRSVYNHGRYGTNGGEVTTNQDQWVTVDYIFYSCHYSQRLEKVIEGDLKLISRLRLPKGYDVKRTGPIPNLASPSDHYPLAAVFLMK